MEFRTNFFHDICSGQLLTKSWICEGYLFRDKKGDFRRIYFSRTFNLETDIFEVFFFQRHLDLESRIFEDFLKDFQILNRDFSKDIF